MSLSVDEDQLLANKPTQDRSGLVLASSTQDPSDHAVCALKAPTHTDNSQPVYDKKRGLLLYSSISHHAVQGRRA